MSDETALRYAHRRYGHELPQTTKRGLTALVREAHRLDKRATRTECAYYILSVSPYWRERGYSRLAQLLNELKKEFAL